MSILPGTTFARRALLPLWCLAVLAAASTASIAAAATAWTLAWSDEFNQPDGSSPDPSKWTYDLGAGGWGNSELEYYTSRTNNARVVGGQLVIEAKRENYLGSSYTSARLKTQGKYSWTLGRMEARIKLPRGQGLWPAFWMLGTNFTSAGWPNCGEIDIMENTGREPALVHGTLHGPGYSGGNGIGASCALPGNPTFADDYHIYALEWTTNQIKWSVDGFQYFSANPASLPAGTTWVFRQPQFLLLNLAVGGVWPGNPDGTTTFPQTMLVDYVRVYAPTNLPAGDANSLLNPGFDAGGLANWTPYGTGFNTVLENVANVPVRSGTNVFKVYGQFTGGSNVSGLYQDVTVGAGQAFTASAWMLTPANDSIAGANRAWLEIQFCDATSNVLALYRCAPVDTTTPPGLWLHLSVTNQFNPVDHSAMAGVTSLTAPANTAFARCQLVFAQPGTAAGSVLFDDLKLAAVESSTTSVLVSATRAESGLQLSFPTYLGLPYQLNWKGTLSAPNWSLGTNLTGNGSTQSLAASAQDPAGFFYVTQNWP